MTELTPLHPEPPPVFEVEDLRKWFGRTRGLFRRETRTVKAVDGVSFTLRQGETLGLVGESGCGKSTTGRCILHVEPPTGGSIRYHRDGEVIDLARQDRAGLRRARREIRMVFQDPHSSLNPRMTVLDLVGEVMRVHGIARGRELEDRVRELLRRVGLRPEYLRRYPHAFSGGERQRIGIARALATSPRVVIADEAVSALDVSVQAQTINLLQRLQREDGLTYLFIAHDLSVVQHISDRVAVMYCGRLVEIGETDDLFARPRHPYTAALLAAVPRPDPRAARRRRRQHVGGEVADPANRPSGCAFHPRCLHDDGARCVREVPELRAVGRRQVACHHAEALDLEGLSE